MARTTVTDQHFEQVLGTLAAHEGVPREEIVRRAVLDRYERARRKGAADLSPPSALRDQPVQRTRVVGGDRDRWIDPVERLDMV